MPPAWRRWPRAVLYPRRRNLRRRAGSRRRSRPTGFEALTVEALRDLKVEKDVEVEALRSDNETLRGELAELRGELDAIRASLRSAPHRN